MNRLIASDTGVALSLSEDDAGNMIWSTIEPPDGATRGASGTYVIPRTEVSYYDAECDDYIASDLALLNTATGRAWYRTDDAWIEHRARDRERREGEGEGGRPEHGTAAGRTLGSSPPRADRPQSRSSPGRAAKLMMGPQRGASRRRATTRKPTE